MKYIFLNLFDIKNLQFQTKKALFCNYIFEIIVLKNDVQRIVQRKK